MYSELTDEAIVLTKMDFSDTDSASESDTETEDLPEPLYDADL